jgi:hypothetical protein
LDNSATLGCDVICLVLPTEAVAILLMISDLSPKNLSRSRLRY